MAKTQTSTSNASEKRKVDEMVGEEEAPATTAGQDALEVRRAVKTKKKKDKKGSDEVEEPSKADPIPPLELAGTGAPGDHSHEVQRPSKKRKAAAEQSAEVSELPKKKTKKDDAVEASRADAQVETPSIKKDKSIKKKDKFSAAKIRLPDPAADETLSDHARKAITYAGQYALSIANPPTRGWKFNKTLQKWLMRNALDDNLVTDPYMDICFKYLVTVQGGARAQLVDLCKKVLEAPTAPGTEPDPPEQEAEGQAAVEPPLSRYSTDRAGKLLKLLQSL